jgi:hypothetical protein
MITFNVRGFRDCRTLVCTLLRHLLYQCKDYEALCLVYLCPMVRTHLRNSSRISAIRYKYSQSLSIVFSLWMIPRYKGATEYSV